MTLARLVLAWAPLGAWFFVVDWAARAAAGETSPAPGARAAWAAAWTLAEAGIVTLFGSLWFDTLGSGGWWLVFALVGLLAAFPLRLQRLLVSDLPRRPEIMRALVGVARYVGGGAILAWRLGP